MDTVWQPLLFWIFSIGMIGTGVLVIANRNPVASALCLVGSFVFMAGLFVLLNAFFLAAIQILVYAGAVMVLFLFIIMLLDLKASEARRRSIFSFVFALLVLVAMVLLFVQVLDLLPQAGTNINELQTTNGEYDARNLGRLLFTKHLLPFITTGVLLLTSTVGVVLLSKRGLGADATSGKPADPTA